MRDPLDGGRDDEAAVARKVTGGVHKMAAAGRGEEDSLQSDHG